MEKTLNSCLQEIIREDNVSGCLVSDQQGLCIVSANVDSNYSGIISAISKEISKIDPASSNPVIYLHHENRNCIIQDHNGEITTAIFKSL